MKSVVVNVRWLEGRKGPWPVVPPTARLTAYRAGRGLYDLFSVFARFEDGGDKAHLHAPVEAMVERLPDVGGVLVLTDGSQPIAECDIVGVGNDET